MNARLPEQDYAYELTIEELRRSMALTALERLRWLDDARRFTLTARDAPKIRYRAGEPEPGSYSADPSD